MKKQILFLSILFLLFFILSYTFSIFNSFINGDISANIKDWVFKVNIIDAIVENDGYKLNLNGTSGEINININTIGGNKSVDYSIELIGDNSIEYYEDNNYTQLIHNNIYNDSVDHNSNINKKIYYKSNNNSDIFIKTKASIKEYAIMKNGNYYSNNTEFWNNNYKPYIKTINFSNDLSNLPSNCTIENLCWDISENENQKKKVYGYLVDTGLKDSTDNTKPLYDLYIVSKHEIFAPINCGKIFSFYKTENNKDISNLTQINFNNNFNTSNVTNMNNIFALCKQLKSLDLSNFNTANVTDMNAMFNFCSSIVNLNLSGFNTSNVTNMTQMFGDCKALTSLDLSGFNTMNVTNMNFMFNYCSSLVNLNLSSFNTVKVTSMHSMFTQCSSLTSLDLSSFNTSNVTNMSYMFQSCSKLKTLNLNNFDTTKVTDMRSMFFRCTSLYNLYINNFNTANLVNTFRMFSNCYSAVATITIRNSNVNDYSSMFSNAAIYSGAKIIVNYTSNTSAIVDSMIATKSASSNVIKGSLVS